MRKICDLHTHSIFSDGTYTPTEIINSAIDIGLCAIALSDHNTIDGLPEFLSAAKNKKIDAIAGAEFSVDLNGTELHLLGLHIPQKSFSQVALLMEEVNIRKDQSNIALIESLNQSGYLIDYDTIKAKTPKGNFNRSHIATELTKKGYTSSNDEAFDTLLSKQAGHYKEPKRLTVWEMIDFISSIGAVSVLAHPFLNLSEKELALFLPRAKKQGLIGMECLYSLYDNSTTSKSFALAQKYNLCYSGGSDFHGAKKPDIKLGIGKGNLEIPYEWSQLLRNRKAL